MTQYVQYISPTEISHPDYTQPPFKGVPNVPQNEPLHRANGYLPLINEPEEREGFTAEPSRYELVSLTKMVTRSRQIVVEDYEMESERPEVFRLDENGEKIKSGEHMEFQPFTEEVDDSFVRVVDWTYEPIPEPEPEPEPVPAPVEYSKYKIKCALVDLGLWEQVRDAIQQAGYWESFLLIQSLQSDVPEFQEALPAIRSKFGADVVDAVLSESEV